MELNYELVENKITYFACTCEPSTKLKYQQALFDLISREYGRNFNNLEELVSYFGLELSDTLVYHLGDIGCGYSIDGYWSDMFSAAIFKPYNSNYPIVELKFDVFAYGIVALDLIIKDWEKNNEK